jgi:hypothetical protein
MSSQHKQRNELKRLYEAALEIVDERNLYNIKQQIKKHTDGSFGEYLKQTYKTEIYNDWWIDVQQSFSKVNLNFLRFKKKIILGEIDEGYEIAPPGYLLRAIVELERIISNKDYLDEYMLSPKTKQSWPTITYSKGLVNNSVDIHNFTKFDNKAAIQMLDRLWVGRQVISPTNSLLRKAKPISWKELGFTNIGSGKATANAINKAMREKQINLRVKFPKNSKGVYVRLQQKSTE